LIARITRDSVVAEGVTLDVYQGVWQYAPTYDPALGSVLGWLMNQARLSAVKRLRFEQRKNFRPPVDSFASWPTDMLRPSASLQERLARRIAAQTGGEIAIPPVPHWKEPEWKEVTPGISCKLLATNLHRNRVSMLVRLAPGVDYPPHSHAGVEELHLLYGDLWINERKLYPGDHNRAEAGTTDERVWSEGGCTCVLITSAGDLIQ
jgi:hypothetical protein